MRSLIVALALLAALGLAGCGSSAPSSEPDADVGKGPLASPRPAPNGGGESARPAPSQSGINEG